MRRLSDIMAGALAKAADPPECATPVGKPAYGMPEDSYRRVGGKWYREGAPVRGEELARLEGMRIPPAWSGVRVSADPKAKLQAIGFDAKGRAQRRYSAEFIAERAQKKFARVRRFARDRKGMWKSVRRDMASGKPEAFLAEIEDRTVIRIGTARDLRAETKAYGLTTLEGRHVAVRGPKVTFDFTAKEGIRSVKVIEDARLAKFIRERKSAAGPNGMLFPDVSAAKFNRYLKGLADNDYTAKDFRTYHATRLARDAVARYRGTELAAKRKRAVVKEILDTVSGFLGNTPAMAKNSYIDPMVWEEIGGLP